MAPPAQRKNRWREWASALKRETTVLVLAARDPRTPWYAKALVVCVAAYAFSPIDLIPDFIPILGQLDDVILVPLGIALAVRMIPPAVLADCCARAMQATGFAGGRVAAVVIVILWMAGIAVTAVWAHAAWRDRP